MSPAERIGPTVTVKRSCSGCKYERSQSYRVQGDSGHDIYCDHPDSGGKVVGDTNWSTPEWCPALKPAAVPMEELREQAAKIAEGSPIWKEEDAVAKRIAAAIRAIPLPAPVALPQAGRPDLTARKAVNTILAELLAPFIPDLCDLIETGNAACTKILAAMSTPTETPTAAAPDDGLMGRYRSALTIISILAADAPNGNLSGASMALKAVREEAENALSTATGDEGGRA